MHRSEFLVHQIGRLPAPAAFIEVSSNLEKQEIVECYTRMRDAHLGEATRLSQHLEDFQKMWSEQAKDKEKELEMKEKKRMEKKHKKQAKEKELEMKEKRKNINEKEMKEKEKQMKMKERDAIANLYVKYFQGTCEVMDQLATAASESQGLSVTHIAGIIIVYAVGLVFVFALAYSKNKSMAAQKRLEDSQLATVVAAPPNGGSRPDAEIIVGGATASHHRRAGTLPADLLNAGAKRRTTSLEKVYGGSAAKKAGTPLASGSGAAHL